MELVEREQQLQVLEDAKKAISGIYRLRLDNLEAAMH